MNFQLKEVVWAKVKGYPWWPAVNKLPDQANSNYKVLFIAEDNYAFLDPCAVKKYEEKHRDFTKGAKTKKLLSAIAKADAMVKNKLESGKKVKKVPVGRQASKLEGSEARESEIGCSGGSEEESERQKEESERQKEESERQKEESERQKEESEEVGSWNRREDNELIGRQKIESAEGELHKLVLELQGARGNSDRYEELSRWEKHEHFFREFRTDHLTSQQLLQSNLTRMVRYIINRMAECGAPQELVQQAEQTSTQMKHRIMEHLTNTHYYDQYLRVVDKNKQNKADIESHISRTLKKVSNHKLKKEFIHFFVQLIGDSVSNGVPFKDKEFLADLKDRKYDASQLMLSKAATQRFADTILKRYQ